MKKIIIGLAMLLGAATAVHADEPEARAKLSIHNVTMGHSVNYTIDVRSNVAVDSVKLLNTFTLEGCILKDKKVKFKPAKKKKESYEYRIAKYVITPQYVGQFIIPPLRVRLYSTEVGEDGQPKVVSYDVKTQSVSFDAAGYHYETHKPYGT